MNERLDTLQTSEIVKPTNITRRDALKIIFNEAAKSVAQVGSLAVALEFLASCASDIEPERKLKLNNRIDKDLEELRQQYGINIKFKAGSIPEFGVTGTELALEDELLSIELLKLEIAKYPAEIWKSANLGTIWAVSNLENYGKKNRWSVRIH